MVIFTNRKIDPLLVPVIPLYSGAICRLVLNVSFWHTLVRSELDDIPPKQVVKVILYQIEE